ncbi:MAG: hypothetical protein KDC00_10010, partial [Flavobacteriales bacterium]|nr:hypothetical protein [Flavobacteriales bacterium]
MLVVRRNEVIVFDISSFAVLDTFLLPVVPLRGGSMLIDDHDRLWSHGPKGTWWRRNLRTGREEILQPLVNGGLPVPGDGQLSWMMDRSGTVWSGTPGFGLVKYRTTSERFHHHALSEEGVARSALVTSDLSGKEVLVFEQFLPLGRTDGVMDSIPLRKALAKENIMPSWGVCVRDPAGRYWVSGPEQEPSAQLYRFDPRTMALDRSSDAADGNCAGLFPGQGTDVWALMADKERSEGARLWRVDSRTGEVADTFHFPDLLPSLGFRGIACWRIDPAGTIWMGTRNGVYGLDPVQGTWSHFTHSEGDSSSISSNEVFSLCLDPEQPERYLWVGTDGKGMSRLDRLSGKCDRQVTSREGLPNDVVYGILPDGRGNLWLSTNMGICQYFPGTGHTNNYSMADGLIGNEFNRYSAERSADGTLYFGGMEGITWFDPEDFYHVRSASPTLITELKLLNKPVRVTDQQVFLPVPVEQLKELVLPYSERMITFGFASTDLSAPAQNEYRYILEGLNTIWIENGTAHEATFTNLDPGSYAFRVQGRNSAGVWDEQGASIHLTILPPWWGTWWFRALMALFLTGSLYAFFRYRLARAMEVVSVRDQIARDLHDEIGSTLSSVALYSTVAQKKAGDKLPEASEMLGRITESTTSVMEAMNDIVWAVNAENDNMGHLVQRMRAFAVRMTEAAECALQFEVDKEMGNARIGMTQRKNLYLIFKEALNNAMKYAACTTIHVQLRRANAETILTVEDDGIGFDPCAKRNGELGGNGLVNMQKRATELRGTLTVRSEAGKGTTVQLRFRAEGSNKSLDPMMAGSKGSR